MEKLELKENEIKELKSRYPFELKKGEKMMCIIIKSSDQTFNHCFICKNNDKFATIESKLYSEYPQYLETEALNYFTVNGQKINKFKTIEDNGIHNSDIILFNKIE